MKTFHHPALLSIVSAAFAVAIPLSAGATASTDAMNAFFVNASEPITRAAFLHAVVELNGGVLNTFSASDPQFADMTPDMSFYKDIMEAAHESWFLGSGDCYGQTGNCYAYPNEALQVRVLAHIVVKAFGLEKTGDAPLFTDNPTDGLYANDMQTAADYCILLPDSKGKVYPTATLTKEQVVNALLAVDQQKTYKKDCTRALSSSSAMSLRSSSSVTSSMRSVAIMSSSSRPKVPVAEWYSTFKDTPADPDERDAIGYVQWESLVRGYDDKTYRPYALINRAEFAKIIVGAIAGPQEIIDCKEPGFSDVPRDTWYTNYVCAAKARGIIGGYDDGTFRPTKNISFVEAAKILALSFDLQVTASSGSNAWYVPYVLALEGKNAIPVTIKGFTYTITRADMAQFIYRLRFHDERKTSLTLSELR